jgi:D-ribose pyranose/furanose isomerase RbsD
MSIISVGDKVLHPEEGLQTITKIISSKVFAITTKRSDTNLMTDRIIPVGTKEKLRIDLVFPIKHTGFLVLNEVQHEDVQIGENYITQYIHTNNNYYLGTIVRITNLGDLWVRGENTEGAASKSSYKFYLPTIQTAENVYEVNKKYYNKIAKRLASGGYSPTGQQIAFTEKQIPLPLEYGRLVQLDDSEGTICEWSKEAELANAFKYRPTVIDCRFEAVPIFGCANVEEFRTQFADYLYDLETDKSHKFDSPSPAKTFLLLEFIENHYPKQLL